MEREFPTLKPGIDFYTEKIKSANKRLTNESPKYNVVITKERIEEWRLKRSQLIRRVRLGIGK